MGAFLFLVPLGIPLCVQKVARLARRDIRPRNTDVWPPLSDGAGLFLAFRPDPRTMNGHYPHAFS
jgi:hypothetical protein